MPAIRSAKQDRNVGIVVIICVLLVGTLIYRSLLWVFEQNGVQSSSVYHENPISEKYRKHYESLYYHYMKVKEDTANYGNERKFAYHLRQMKEIEDTYTNFDTYGIPPSNQWVDSIKPFATSWQTIHLLNAKHQ